jgi:hypothetical protein
MVKSNEPRPTAQEKDLWKIVENHLAQGGFRLSPDCERSLFRFVADAERHLDSEVVMIQREQAQANLRTFLDEMMAQAEARRSGIIGQDVFESVRKKLCPLSPFPS